MLDYFFKKNMRLLNAKSFQNVFSQPFQRNTLELSILGRLNSLTHPRLGLSISRKNIKHAYHRNLIKRLIRESFRMSQHQLISMDFVVIAKKNIFHLKNKKIIDMLKTLWSHYYQ